MWQKFHFLSQILAYLRIWILDSDGTFLKIYHNKPSFFLNWGMAEKSYFLDRKRSIARNQKFSIQIDFYVEVYLVHKNMFVCDLYLNKCIWLKPGLAVFFLIWVEACWNPVAPILMPFLITLIDADLTDFNRAVVGFFLKID